MENQQFGFGAIPSPKDIRDYKLSSQALVSISVPETFQLNKIPIKNQGSQSTCAAHTLCELVEYHNKRQTGNFTKFSTDFIYGLRFDGDYMGEGMHLRDALKNLQNYGDVYYTTIPGNSNVPTARNKVFSNFESHKIEAYPNRISTYYRITSVKEMQYAISHDGPVVIGMRWYSSASLDKDNVYTFNSSKSCDGHAVLAVGYDKEYVILQNSWGASWGNKGYFKVKYSDFKTLFFDVFGVTDNITSIKKPNKFTDVVSPIINKILNIFSKIFKK